MGQREFLNGSTRCHSERTGAAGPLSRDWIAPAESVKSSEVAIGRAELCVVLDGEGGKMGVGGEIPARTQRAEKVPQKPRVSRTGMYDHG